jgi:hypothetical protein
MTPRDTAEPAKPEAQEPEHTPEPWGMETREAGIWITGPTGEHIALVVLPKRRVSAANARRIGACVNALRGLKTSDIEAGVVGELVEALKAAQHRIDPNLPYAEDIEAQLASVLARLGEGGGR